MNLCNINHSFNYELEKLVRIFMPFEKIIITDNVQLTDCCAVTKLERRENDTLLSANLVISGKNISYSDITDNFSENYEKDCERILAVQLFNCFVTATGYMPEWGILTGVRPAKLFSRLCEKNGISETEKYFSEELKVNQNKISLCREAVDGENKIISLSGSKSFSLYIAIPFCPTRCTYCSFVSHSVEKAKDLVPKYVELLCKELNETSEYAKKFNLRLETIYIGGGTPTTLSADQLTVVMETVKKCFDLSNLREYTVEAGRPDTITADKLLAIKNNGATRISINPQTMNDSVLEEIGRKHTSAQTIEAYKIARSCGIDNINMDLIAGLPTDTFESFKSTVDKIIQLNPESVTVHSLSMKRASALSVNGELPENETGIAASKMVDYARNVLTNADIKPYYMYRQSKTVGNLENVGYSKQGFECLYNVYIMDETHTILACGASAVTKLREPDGDHIERIFNYKYPYEYINRFDEQMKRKDGISIFYEKYCE